ncbi:MAG: type II toxin-antitoxin system PemK/MazF family toxin [Candidatus Obscuribacterales bacterium]|nr:type II toxin-antitoxin system PemK/MazF family toxin [Candidatus Obscuribacterales bacterium]
MMPLKGEVWEIDLNPAQGHEQAKIRPCLVISNDLMNTKMELSIIVPFTGTAWHTKSGKLSPAMVEILPPEGGLTKPSYSMAFQVRTVSHTRFTNKLGTVTAHKLLEVVRSVQEIVDH